jgi:hypothetical protein
MAISHPFSFLRFEDSKSRQGRSLMAILSFLSSPVGRRAGYGSKKEDHRVSDGFEIERGYSGASNCINHYDQYPLK